MFLHVLVLLLEIKCYILNSFIVPLITKILYYYLGTKPEIWNKNFLAAHL